MKTLLKGSRKSYQVVILILFCTGFIQQVAAQNQPKVWDLKSCIEYAEKNNIQLKTLRLTASSDNQDLRLAKNAKYPDLTGSATATSSYANKSLLSESTYGVNSSMVLFKGNYYNEDIKSNTLSVQSANLDIAAADNNIVLEITQAYLNVLLARENIEYEKDLVSTSESQVAQCQEKYKSGTAALKDLMQLKATLANDKYSLVEAENTKRQDLLALKTILQVTNDSTFDITPDIETTELSATALDTVKQIALQIMPQIKSSELLVGKQTVEVNKARAAFYPSLSLSGGISTGYLSSGSDQYMHQLSTGLIPQVGLTLSVPIFSRNSNAIGVAKSKIALEQAKLSAENVKTELMQTVEQAYINVNNTTSQFNASKEQLDYAKEAYRISGEELKIGANNNVEYLQQKNIYIQALQQYIQSKYSMMLYTKIYNFYKGIPVTS